METFTKKMTILPLFFEDVIIKKDACDNTEKICVTYLLKFKNNILYFTYFLQLFIQC